MMGLWLTENEDGFYDYMEVLAFALKSFGKEYSREVLQSHFPGSFETWRFYCS